MNALYSTPSFEDSLTYSGSDLGCRWCREKTRFRLWAPTAQEVTLCLYASGTPGDTPLERLPMRRAEQGTWTAEKEGDLHGRYYTYAVRVDGLLREVCDPYARSSGVNGQRAMIFDPASTDPDGWSEDADPHAGLPITDAVIYELHIRDLSMDPSSGIRHKGKFLGLTERGTATPGGQSTGLDHIKALGITHVQLMPIFDFGFTDEASPAPAYNWGYDPVNYNFPEGSYATDPFDGTVRVWELKQMVKALHENGLSVVMDVVYNHVYDPDTFCLNAIVPGYFSRPDANGSCCGNDTATERSMVRQYILDSLCYWAEEYHIDGFRLDLAGLMDITTIRQAMDAVHRRRPNVLFYGEGWTMDTLPTKDGTALCTQTRSGEVPGFSFFNDTIRDLLRGSVFDPESPGFVGGAACAKAALEGCFLGDPGWASQPYQCINYVSCHDNHTLFDRLTLACPDASRELRIRQSCLAGAFSILSQGVPFLQAGEEFLRTKPCPGGGFDGNSFRSPDAVNALKWGSLDSEEIRAVTDYYRGLIAFRKAHPGLRCATREETAAHIRPIPCDNPATVAFSVQEDGCQLLLIFHAGSEVETLPLPPGQWESHIHDRRAGCRPLSAVTGSVTIPPVSAAALVRREFVDVVAALIWDEDKFLICQRPAHKARGLLWEFVGGKVEPGETMPQALCRECREELGIQVAVDREFYRLIHEYPDLRIRLTLFHCRIICGTPTLLEHQALAWIHPGQIDDYAFCPADVEILEQLRRRYGAHPRLT